MAFENSHLHHNHHRDSEPPNHISSYQPLIEGLLLLDEGQHDDDQLFLLPDRVLAMDSISFREDVAAIAPGFLPRQQQQQQSNNSPHNSLDSTDSNRSLKLLEDTEGLRLARASDGCRTLWLCKFTFLARCFVLNKT